MPSERERNTQGYWRMQYRCCEYKHYLNHSQDFPRILQVLGRKTNASVCKDSYLHDTKQFSTICLLQIEYKTNNMPNIKTDFPLVPLHTV